MAYSSVIFDFETLSKNPVNGVIVSCAMLEFQESRFTSLFPYTYDELLEKTGYIKFDVTEQVEKFSRKIQKGTLDWWNRQSESARQMIQPNKDLDVSIVELPKWITDYLSDNPKQLVRVFTRGSFDQIILDSICMDTDQENPIHWAKYRDIRSFIEALAYGQVIDNNFMINELKDKFVAHNPIHDVAMDVMRLQFLIRAIYSA